MWLDKDVHTKHDGVPLPHPISEIGCALDVLGGAGKLSIDITSPVWQLAIRCLILGLRFRVMLSSKDIAEIEDLRDSD